MFNTRRNTVASVAEQDGLNRTCSKIPEDRVLLDVAQSALSDQGLHCLAFFLSLFYLGTLL